MPPSRATAVASAALAASAIVDVSAVGAKVGAKHAVPEPTANIEVFRLGPDTAPSGTIIGVFNDAHIGIHDERALDLVIECFDRVGADVVIANGDIHDCAAVAPHERKRRMAALNSGNLLEEAATGRQYIDWLLTRKLAIYGPGNHEDWINDVARDNNAIGSVTVAGALGLPVGPNFKVLEHGYQIRLGSLVIEHGDCLFPRSSGGVNVARNILLRYPDQSTIVGHFHVDGVVTRTSPDHRGILRSHSAHVLGHLSNPRAHREYAGRDPNWQQSFAIIRVWYDGTKPRFTIHHIEVHRDRYDRPIFEYEGHVYR